MTRHVDQNFAKDWGDAHECKADSTDQQGTPDSLMDLHNNEVGRNFAMGNPNLNCRDMCAGDANNANGYLCWIVDPVPGHTCPK